MLDFIWRPLVIFICFHEIIFWAYFLQLKEYRLDRLKASLEDISDWRKVITDSFNLRYWYRPRPTARAVFIVTITLTLVLLIYRKIASPYLLVVLFLLTPIISHLVSVMVMPIFWLTKQIIIYRARQKRWSFKGKVIGITGSYGKSSTKELLTWVLSAKYKVAKTQRNDNSEIGVAETVLKLRGNEDVLVVEMGAYRKGEIAAICQVVSPEIGIITGIGDQHLSLFGSLEKIRQAKYELIESLPENGLALVADRDFRLSELRGLQVTREKVEFNFENQHFSLPILGTDLVRNVLAVIKVSKRLGMTLKEISSRLEILPNNLFYPKIFPGLSGSAIIDNSYNVSFESFIACLNYLDLWEGYLKMVVTSGLIEVGSRRMSDHKAIGERLKLVDRVIVTSRKSFNDLNVSSNVSYCPESELVIGEIKKLLGQKVVVAFIGRTAGVIIESVMKNGQ